MVNVVYPRAFERVATDRAGGDEGVCSTPPVTTITEGRQKPRPDERDWEEAIQRVWKYDL